MTKKKPSDKDLYELIEEELDKAGFKPTPITESAPAEEADPNEARKESLINAIRTHAKRNRK